MLKLEITIAICHINWQIVMEALKAAALKGAKSIGIPMVGAGAHGKDPLAMTRAIVRACGEFARTQVSFCCSVLDFLVRMQKSNLIQ